MKKVCHQAEKVKLKKNKPELIFKTLKVTFPKMEKALKNLEY